MSLAYPFMQDVPDTVITEGDSLSLLISGDSWHYNALYFTVESPMQDSILNVGRTGGCTCSETQWSAFYYLSTNFYSAGEYSIIFTCHDTMGVTDSDTMLLTIENMPFPPTISAFPDTILYEHDTLVFALNAFVEDFDHSDSEIEWSLLSTSSLDITIIDNISMIQATSPFGTETLIFKAQDPDGYFDIDTFIVETINVNDPPLISDMPETLLTEGGSFLINLDDFVHDPEDAPETILWEFYGNIYLDVSISETRLATIAALNPLPFAIDSIYFIATDPLGIADSCLIQIMLMPSSNTNEPIPQEFQMSQAYPNPFNSSFVIEIPKNESYQVSIFDEKGQKIHNERNIDDFKYEMEQEASGIYFLVFKFNNRTENRRVIFVK